MTTLAYYARVGMPEPVISSAARAAEEGGLGGFWVNNPPGQDGLTPVAWAAGATTTIRLGSGVIPVTAHPPDDVARRVHRLGLPLDRYRLGIGSGTGDRARDRVRAALRTLRSEVGCELVVGALGPLMCTLAGEEADSLLLNAVTPVHAHRSKELAEAGAEASGRPAPRVYVSLLIGLGAEGQAGLDRSAAFLARIPSYAAHFERTGLTPADTTIAARDVSELRDKLAAWRGVVDELVVGSATNPEHPDDVRRLVEAIRSAWQATAS
jgi:alkanesulfonate monooxygenase SsuD/methylene tetrahydromethanopterin reductase-like flavin-dependent oxidoreductase (luciferase family)